MKTMTKLVSTFAVSLLLAACSGKSPEDTAQKFVSEIYNGNADAVVAMVHLDDADKQKPGVQEMLSGKIKAGVAEQKAFAEQQGGVESITAEPAAIDPKDNNRANVNVKTQFKSGKTHTDRVRLISVDGKSACKPTETPPAPMGGGFCCVHGGVGGLAAKAACTPCRAAARYFAAGTGRLGFPQRHFRRQPRD